MVSKYVLNQIKKYEGIMRQREYNLRYRASQYGHDTKDFIGVYGDKRYDYNYSNIKQGKLSDQEAHEHLVQLRRDIKKGVGLYKVDENQITPKNPQAQAMSELHKYERDFNNENEKIRKYSKQAIDIVNKDVEEVYNSMTKEDDKKFGLNKKQLEKKIDSVSTDQGYRFTGNKTTLDISKFTKKTEQRKAMRQLAKGARGGYAGGNIIEKTKEYKRDYLMAMRTRREEVTTELPPSKQKDYYDKIDEAIKYVEDMGLDEFIACDASGLLPDISQWYLSQSLENLADQLDTDVQMMKHYKPLFEDQIEYEGKEEGLLLIDTIEQKVSLSNTFKDYALNVKIDGRKKK